MKRILTILTTCSVWCFGLFTGCDYKPLQPENKAVFDYTVSLNTLTSDTIHVECRIVNLTDGSPLLFLAPPVYADNPWLDQDTVNFHNLRITDEFNEPVHYSTDSILLGNHKNLRIFVTGDNSHITMRYAVTLQYVDTISGPYPFIDDKTAYWRGNNIFVIPFVSSTLSYLWRRDIDFSVKYIYGDFITPYGDPTPAVRFRNIYELLFSTNGLNGELMALGIVGGQAYEFISLNVENKMSMEQTLKAKQYCDILLKDITSVFTPYTEAPMSIFMGINNAGGLEGMYGFSMINLGDDDSKGWFPMIMAHEMTHSWVGVRVGDYEDPWWKEGTTTYLGVLFALRNNVSTDYFLSRYLLSDLSNDAGVQKFAMNDPEVRVRIFADSMNCERLAYEKGAQVTMLLDRRIRESSLGKTSIDKIIGDFTREYDGKAFYRHEYINFIHEKSGAFVADIIDSYVLNKGAIPVAVLQENCSALQAMGAFGSQYVSIPDEKTIYLEKQFTF